MSLVFYYINGEGWGVYTWCMWSIVTEQLPLFSLFQESGLQQSGDSAQRFVQGSWGLDKNVSMNFKSTLSRKKEKNCTELHNSMHNVRYGQWAPLYIEHCIIIPLQPRLEKCVGGAFNTIKITCSSEEAGKLVIYHSFIVLFHINESTVWSCESQRAKPAVIF